MVTTVFSGAGWAVQPLTPDYGLDQRVEIFDAGIATGLAFYTQVKATDESDLRRALAVPFETSTLNYFAAVEAPILLLRYHSPTRALYGRWFHRIDDRAANTATRTIRFAADGAVAAEDLAAIRNEVRLFRRLRTAAPAWPLDVEVRSTSPSMSGHDIAVACAAAAGRQRYVRFTPAASPEEMVTASVDVDEAATVIHFGVASVTFHGAPADDIDEVAHDVVFGTGLALGVADRHDAANPLMAAGLAKSAAAESIDLVLAATATLARSGDIGGIIKIGRALLDRGSAQAAEILVPLAVVPQPHIDSNDEAVISELYDDIIEALIALAPISGAAASYSAANWRFSRGDYGGALQRYERALHLDPDYVSRPHYLRERAAAHFECGDYDAALRWYETAYETSSDPQTLARIGDTLLHAGRFADAVSAFDQYEHAGITDEPIWFFKAHTARQLYETYGRSYSREVDAAVALATRALDVADTPEGASLAAEALELDPLCGEAWWAPGRHRVNNGDLERGFPALLMAVGQGGAADSWAELFLVATAKDDGALLTTVARAAFLREGEAFIDGLRLKLADEPAEARSAVLRAVDATIADLRDARSFTVRFRGDDVVEEIQLR